jgi:integrase
VWTMPASRMKTGVEHRVALSERAIAPLRQLPIEGGDDFVSIGPRARCGLSNMSMTAVLRRMGLTVRGFRSSFGEWAAERTSFPDFVVQMALAHAVGDKVEAAYRRGDLLRKRQALAEGWPHSCTSATAAGGAVIPLRKTSPYA